jgi:hypothetical protein
LGFPGSASSAWRAQSCPAAQFDTDPARVTIVKPQLGLTKRADESRVRAGEIVSYVIRVSNPSKRAVRNVRMRRFRAVVGHPDRRRRSGWPRSTSATASPTLAGSSGRGQCR